MWTDKDYKIQILLYWDIFGGLMSRCYWGYCLKSLSRMDRLTQGLCLICPDLRRGWLECLPTYSPRCPFYENWTSSHGGFCIPYIHLDISQIATKNQTELRSVPASLSSDIADNNWHITSFPGVEALSLICSLELTEHCP